MTGGLSPAGANGFQPICATAPEINAASLQPARYIQGVITPYPRVALHPGAFDTTLRRWRDALDLEPASRRGGTADTLSIVTWNVWFGEFHWHVRASALLEIVHRRDPDVVCLQEVTPEFLDVLLAEQWVRDEYCVSTVRSDAVDPYGVVLLTRLPIHDMACQELPTSMGRSLVMATVAVGDRRVTIGTVHLESRSRNADVRGEQLDVALPVLRSMSSDALLVGDFNMAEDHAEEPRISTDFVDVWSMLRGAAPGYTMDTDANPMNVGDEGIAKQVRYDRVLLHSPDRALRPFTITLCGTEVIAAPGVFPSDHFGLAATFIVQG